MPNNPSPAALRAAQSIRSCAAFMLSNHGGVQAGAEIIDREFAQDRQRAEKLAEALENAINAEFYCHGATSFVSEARAALAAWKGEA